MHRFFVASSIIPHISEPEKGIPKMSKLNNPEIEYFKLSKVLKLSPNQWKVYFPEPKVVLLDKIKGRFVKFLFK